MNFSVTGRKLAHRHVPRMQIAHKFLPHPPI